MLYMFLSMRTYLLLCVYIYIYIFIYIFIYLFVCLYMHTSMLFGLCSPFVLSYLLFFQEQSESKPLEPPVCPFRLPAAWTSIFWRRRLGREECVFRAVRECVFRCSVGHSGFEVPTHDVIFHSGSWKPPPEPPPNHAVGFWYQNAGIFAASAFILSRVTLLKPLCHYAKPAEVSSFEPGKNQF